MVKFSRAFLVVILLLTVLFPSAYAQQIAPAPPMTADQLQIEVERRAFRFFWEKTDPNTGLTNDRARNVGGEDDYTVASIASTGYALASLPIAVQHKWVAREDAYQRALLTLRYVSTKFPNEHGWYYHFIDKRTGERVWNCELSSIDTALLLLGALSAGQYWHGTEVQRLANAIYDRVDWTWMRTNGGLKPDKVLLAMGWKPEDGFLKNDWDHYCELMYLYLLGMGAKTGPLPKESWTAWTRNEIEYKGMHTLAGGPIFMHQMAHTYYDFKGKRDALGWDYWVCSLAATEINRQYCLDRTGARKTYGPNIWGLNACDAPDGYNAFEAPGKEDGTVSPTGAFAAILFTPDLANAAAMEMYTRFHDRLWGRYGFSDSFNLDRDWFDPDVIGIDLGMALLAIEDVRTGLPWKLLASHPATKRAMKLAGFHTTREPEPRPLHKP
ncbi:MAG TPA: glucoamylase family protein [Chthonomonadaceae bacterium]|nr:glucoamylase family protein [Chthonomonadaceae bacterium]